MKVSSALRCSAKATLPFSVMEKVVFGLRPMKRFSQVMYPKSSKLRVWLARFPSVNCNSDLSVAKSSDSLTISADMMPSRALLSKALFIFSNADNTSM